MPITGNANFRFSIIGAVRNFLGLNDTPDSYDGLAGYHATVNNAETALEFTETREKLQSNRTYYVRTDGSDLNDGLTNTAGGAFLTIQTALDAVWYDIDLNSFAVVVQVGNGTYTGEISLQGQLVGQANAAEYTVTLRGDTTTPNNVHINNAQGITIYNTNLRVEGFKISASAGSCLRVVYIGALLYYSAIEFGTAGFSHIYTFFGGESYHTDGTVTISGGALYHIRVDGDSNHIAEDGTSYTLTGTPAFTAFIRLQGGQAFFGSNMTITGSATGKRFEVEYGGAIVNHATGGDALTFFPGNAAGTLAGGGTYENKEGLSTLNSLGGSVIVGPAALGTTATDGFFYVPTCAGTPTGVPTSQTGMAPIVVNTTNNKLYFYSSGAWKDAGP